MDPILIGTFVSDHVIMEMIKPTVLLVKGLWQMIISSVFMITWLITNMLLLLLSQGENKISASIFADV